MKISDIVFKTYKEIHDLKQWDLKSMPTNPKWWLQPLAWVLSIPETISVKSNIIKTNMKDLKEPFIMLCNHNSFLDFKVATRSIFPRRANFIVAVDGFIGREGIMRNVGCFMKRKFVSDISLAKQVKHSITKNKVVCQIYPEARYSLVGTNSPLPDSLGKLVKWIGAPLVTLISHGHHLRQPFWNLKTRKVKTKSYLTQIVTKEEIKELSVDEINRRIREAFTYDDYKYQLVENIRITESFRAEGLHKPLYKCPHCKEEFVMDSKDHRIFCKSCGVVYEMDELGRLNNPFGKTIFSHIPDWFDWEREEVRKEIINDTYDVSIDVLIDILPNNDGFYRIGEGKLTHNKDGFTLVHPDIEVNKPVQANFGCHIEYDYFTKGDCVSFSTSKDTFYLYPIDQSYNVTKFHFATEELYKHYVINKK